MDDTQMQQELIQGIEQALKKRLEDPKYMPIRIQAKHWYQWLSPSFWRMKKTLEAFGKTNFHKIQKEVKKEMMERLMYGDPQ